MLSIFVGRGIHPFLAVSAPGNGGVWVVEGWLPDTALEAVIREHQSHPLGKVYVTGGPLDWGGPLSEYKTYAQLGAATLTKLGLNVESVQAVPTPWVRQDRTYTSALYLRKWFLDHGGSPKELQLITVGPHARRSRLLYEKAFGKGVTVGVVALPVRDYDPRHWWRSSQGFRAVTGEAMAYLYARVFFSPKEPKTGELAP